MIKIKIPAPYRKVGTPIIMEVGKCGFKRTETISPYNLIDGQFFYVDDETTYIHMGFGVTSTRQKVQNFQIF